ncbi:unnamed protein product [Strongylus vulgaris]|uniref:Cytochrome P450 n=1 Tax=Strongylus vulgaris TaxID=40348 RepID=A0A3P7I7Q3_STRVU|nr:unnamed protein product [Strongylus vulgaris]
MSIYYLWQLTYWSRRGIPGPPGIIFIGNMHSLTDRSEPVTPPIPLPLSPPSPSGVKYLYLQLNAHMTASNKPLHGLRSFVLSIVNENISAHSLVAQLSFSHSPFQMAFIPLLKIQLILKIQFDKVQQYGKVYGIHEGLRRTLVTSDINMVRELFMQKFEYFHGRKGSTLVGDVENDARVHLFESQGVRWKRLRAISSPAFSAGSLKKVG